MKNGKAIMRKKKIPDNQLDWTLLGTISENGNRWQMHVKRYGKGAPKALVPKSEYPTKDSAKAALVRMAMLILSKKKDQQKHDATKIQSIAIADLVTNPVQPPIRTTDAAIAGLASKIAKHGLLGVVIVMRYEGKWIILDGHRRKTAWEALGGTRIDCQITTEFERPELGFFILNNKTRKMSGNEVFTGWAMADPSIRDQILGEMKVASKIRKMVEYLGEAEAVELGLQGAAPEMATITSNALNHMANCFPEAKYQNLFPTPREFIYYMFNNHAQQEVKTRSNTMFGKYRVVGKPNVKDMKAFCLAIKRGLDLKHALTVGVEKK